MSSQMSERERGTFPSQPEINPRDTRATNNTSNSAQLNAVHVLQSGKEVDNQVEVHSPTKSADPVTDPSSSALATQMTRKLRKSLSLRMIHQLPFQTGSDPRKTQHRWKRFLDIFKQVEVNIPLLEAVEQVSSYAKLLKDLCAKKRAHQTPKKLLLCNH